MTNRAGAGTWAERLGVVGFVVTLWGSVGCGGSSGPAAGHEKGPCYGNGTCDPGLACLSMLCVKGSASGTAGAGGGAGAGDGAGTAGSVGTGGAAGGVSGVAGGGAAGALGTAGAAGAGAAPADGAAGAGSAGAAGADGGAAGADGGAGAGGADASADGAGGTTPTCATYCAAILANCTGASAQYVDAPSCAAACPSFPIKGDVSNNTLGCRLSHATAAATEPTACAAAGPSGGGVCGNDPCVPYCTLVAAHCPTQTHADCLTFCHGTFLTDTTAYSSTLTSGGSTTYCYLAFAVLSSVAPEQQCPHTVPNMVACRNN
jgi:hypothetical protein